MTLLLTGATGYIGSSVLTSLLARGHDVVALVRTDAKAAAVAATGARTVVGDVTDLELLARLVRDSDGIIHTASPGDETNAAVDSDLIDVVIRESAGSSKPFVHTGGIWIFGSGADLDEASPLQPLPITGWRGALEARVRASDVRSTIVAPGIVYGHGVGIPSMFLDGAEVTLVGDGSQHWTTVHVDDLGELYASAFEAAAADEYYLAVSGDNPTVRDLGEAAGHGRPIVTESSDESRARLGASYADALLLDQSASGRHAREVLGWLPTHPTLLDELSV